jgi:hypothetical protein
MIDKLKKEIIQLWARYEKANSREERIFIRSNIIQAQKRIDHIECLEFENYIKELKND